MEWARTEIEQVKLVMADSEQVKRVGAEQKQTDLAEEEQLVVQSSEYFYR